MNKLLALEETLQEIRAFHGLQMSAHERGALTQACNALREAEALLRECRRVMDAEGFDDEVKRIDALLAAAKEKL